MLTCSKVEQLVNWKHNASGPTEESRVKCLEHRVAAALYNSRRLSASSTSCVVMGCDLSARSTATNSRP